MAERLCTKRNKDDYERIIDIFVNDSSNEIPYLNHPDTCKLIFITSGSLKFCVNNTETVRLNAPASIILSNKDVMTITVGSKFKATSIFFKPTLINDSFDYDSIYSNKFEECYGLTIYQDYLAIRNFFIKEENVKSYLALTDISYDSCANLLSKLKKELTIQYDGFWPCRSRSYFFELLFFLNTQTFNNGFYEADNLTLTDQIIDYLKLHLDEKITLTELTTHFHINRNSLNKLFSEATGLTCLGYLNKLRFDFAKLLLKDTELPISEIAARISFDDQNYFSRVFRKEFGMNPTEYRYN